MTIQKLSSGSKKNCRFFCVCRDFAGLMGQKVLKENKGKSCNSDDDSIKSGTVSKKYYQDAEPGINLATSGTVNGRVIYQIYFATIQSSKNPCLVRPECNFHLYFEATF